MSDFETRFDGIARLYGKGGLEKLRAAHVCVVGIGGVGTWAAEALARSGLGALTLVDLDEVCVSNINRQLHALTETIGRAKVEVMAERIRAINPECRVKPEQKFFNAQTAAELLAVKCDFVLDAIDSVRTRFCCWHAVAEKICRWFAAAARADGVTPRKSASPIWPGFPTTVCLPKCGKNCGRNFPFPRTARRQAWIAFFPPNRRCSRNRTAPFPARARKPNPGRG